MSLNDRKWSWRPQACWWLSAKRLSWFCKSIFRNAVWSGARLERVALPAQAHQPFCHQCVDRGMNDRHERSPITCGCARVTSASQCARDLAGTDCRPECAAAEKCQRCVAGVRGGYLHMISIARPVHSISSGWRRFGLEKDASSTAKSASDRTRSAAARLSSTCATVPAFGIALRFPPTHGPGKRNLCWLGPREHRFGGLPASVSAGVPLKGGLSVRYPFPISRQLFSVTSTSNFFAAALIRFHAASRSSSVTSFT